MNEDAPTNSTAGVVGTGNDEIHWKDKKKSPKLLRQIVKRKPVQENMLMNVANHVKSVTAAKAKAIGNNVLRVTKATAKGVAGAIKEPIKQELLHATGSAGKGFADAFKKANK